MYGVCLFDKNKGSATSVTEESAEGLHKPVIRRFKRREFNTRFKNKDAEAT